MDIGRPISPWNPFRCKGISLDDRYPRTSRFGRLLTVRIESKIPIRRTGYGDDQQDRCQLLQSTKAACQMRSPFRQRDDRIANFQFETALGKTLSELNNDVRAQMRLARSGEKIGFCLLQESQFRFLRF